MEYRHSKLLFLSMLSFDVFVPTIAHSLYILDKWFVQVYLNASLYRFVASSIRSNMTREEINVYKLTSHWSNMSLKVTFDFLELEMQDW